MDARVPAFLAKVPNSGGRQIDGQTCIEQQLEKLKVERH